MNFARLRPFRLREPAPLIDPDESGRLPSAGTSTPVQPLLNRPRNGSGLRDPVEDMATQGGAGPQDSLTLGQLKAHTAAILPKPKVRLVGPSYLKLTTYMVDPAI